MDGISDIKIVGVDQKRPPIIRKEPYIDIFFELSHKAPPEWCIDFNRLMKDHPTTPKIQASEGLYIEAWVKKSDEIASFVELLKKTVTECNDQYIAKINLAVQKNDSASASLAQEQGEQDIVQPPEDDGGKAQGARSHRA